MKRVSLFAAASIAAAALAAPASATLLTGLTVQVSHEFPTLASFDLGPVDYTVGTSTPVSYAGIADISVGDKTFTIDVHCGAGCNWNSTAFNGFGLFDTYNVASPFKASIGSGTNYTGFDASRLTFDGNSVHVNLAGLSANGLIVINLAGAVPEPQSWTLMIAGFGLVGVGMRKRPKALVAA